MNPEELWETSLNPENRHLIRLMPNNGASIADTIDRFMGGNKTIAFRKEFIENATVENEVE